MLRYAAETFSTFEQIEQYIENYPLPATPELRQLAEMEQYVAALPAGTAQELLEQAHRRFVEDLDRRIRLPEQKADTVKWVTHALRERAQTELAYTAPGLLEQAEDVWEQLQPTLQLLAGSGSVPNDAVLEQVWRALNQYFDEVELVGDVMVSAEQRDEFLVDLLEEAQEIGAEYMEEAQDIVYEALEGAEDGIRNYLQEELDDLADELAEEVMLEVDPVGYMTEERQPFRDWPSMVQWFEQLLDAQQSLTKGPKFVEKSRRRGPRVVDVTHLQEDQQHAVQR